MCNIASCLNVVVTIVALVSSLLEHKKMRKGLKVGGIGLSIITVIAVIVSILQTMRILKAIRKETNESTNK
jgi:Na+/melibiose symporter-like transporter